MEYTVIADNLTREFPGIKAVDDVSLNIQSKEMLCIVGPDGAGKTTLIRMLCGLLNPTKGNIKIAGFEIKKNREEVNGNIGYLSQKFSLYGDLTIDENIAFFAEIHHVKDYKNRREELLEFTRLSQFRKRLAENLSGGMKQKLALCCSLIHSPKVLFLDEPSSGVDPVSRRDFWKILADLIDEEMSIVMTTPYLDEAERANRVALMNNGKIIALDTPQNIRSSIKAYAFEVVTKQTRKAHEIVERAGKNFNSQTFGDRINVILDKKEDIKSVLDEFKTGKIEVESVREIPLSLENVFILLMK